jgi:hypothetical protein
MNTSIKLHQSSSMMALKSTDKKKTLVVLSTSPSGDNLYTLFDQQVLADAYIHAFHDSKKHSKQ